MTKDAVATINLKRSPLRVVHGGADNIGGDETITIGNDHHDDGNDEVNTRPNSCLSTIFNHAWNISMFVFNSINLSPCRITQAFNRQKGESKVIHQQERRRNPLG